MNDIKHPVETVPYADAGLISNPTEKNPDAWLEKKDEQELYYRTPTNEGYYDSDPQRPIGRHNQRGNAGFADGHAAPIRVSLMGLQYYPGTGPGGQVAWGNSRWTSKGNDVYDPRWMWDFAVSHKPALNAVFSTQHNLPTRCSRRRQSAHSLSQRKQRRLPSAATGVSNTLACKLACLSRLKLSKRRSF